MMGDITPATEIFEEAPYPRAHTHYWSLANTKTTFESENNNGGAPLYHMVEYAYLICKCSEVVKTKVKTKENV